jgi:hypothetical protein
VKLVVTSLAVPPPAALTAAASALVAASPVTAFSWPSWEAVPCAGIAGAACAGAVVVVADPEGELEVVVELVAFAMAEPPRASAANAPKAAIPVFARSNIVVHLLSSSGSSRVRR